MRDRRVALVPLARVNFDMDLAQEVTDAFRTRLIYNGLRVVGDTTLITDQQGAATKGRELQDEDFDLLLIFQATFADSTMVTTLTKMIDRPVFLWAVPDQPTGGRLRLNSLCGVNLAAHALTLRDRRYDYIYASPSEKPAIRHLKTVTTAAAVYGRLQEARIGLVGEHPAGMDTCRVDPERIANSMGAEVVQIPLSEVFEQVRSTPAGEIRPVRDRLAKRLKGLDELDQEQLNTSLAVYRVLKQLARQQHLDALAVRCWPEFFTDLRCSACGPMAMLTDEAVPCSCEADIKGVIAQLVLQWLSDGTAFGTDMVSADRQDDTMVLWHCGLAPLAMADLAFETRATVHSNRRLPLLMEFSLKPGRVTFARLSQATGELRWIVAGGEMLSRPPSFSGTSGVVRFDDPVGDVLDQILQEGLEHHISLTYGDHAEAVASLAEMLNMPLKRLTGSDHQ